MSLFTFILQLQKQTSMKSPLVRSVSSLQLPYWEDEDQNVLMTLANFQVFLYSRRNISDLYTSLKELPHSFVLIARWFPSFIPNNFASELLIHLLDVQPLVRNSWGCHCAKTRFSSIEALKFPIISTTQERTQCMDHEHYVS